MENNWFPRFAFQKLNLYCYVEAWPEHKLVCESLRDVRARSIAKLEEENDGGESGSGQSGARPSGSASIKQNRKYFADVLQNVPGLQHRCNFLAWWGLGAVQVECSCAPP
jgi:hypothetical protein